MDSNNANRPIPNPPEPDSKTAEPLYFGGPAHEMSQPGLRFFSRGSEAIWNAPLNNCNLKKRMGMSPVDLRDQALQNMAAHRPIQGSAGRPSWLSRTAVLMIALTATAWMAGCSVVGSRESPLRQVTEGSPTVIDVYRGHGQAGTPSARESARDALRRESAVRPIAQGDGDTQRYWSALEPMRQRFARVPNPDLVMVVYPHLARGQYPVPGYVTVFPMYEQAQYALPGEVEEDLLQGRSSLAAEAAGRKEDRR